jgi:large conductance mechanosensitive channel
MKFLKEFKEFAVKGNMIDMAVGIIIGASFNKVIDVLVKKIFLPPLAFVTDNLHYQDKRYILKEAIRSKEGSITEKEIAIYYGELFEVTLDFLVVGLTIFIVVKGMNRLKNKSQDVKDKTVETPKDIELLTNLNKLMAEQNALLKALKQ